MRWLLAAVLFALVLGTLRVVGCGETTGTGGVAGDGGNGGYVCHPQVGEPGSGGGGYFPPEPPGVYSGEAQVYEDRPVFVRFETNRDCTALVPSTECSIDRGNTEPAFFEIDFVGRDEQAGRCGGAIAVTSALVTEVPIEGPRFTIGFTDDDGAEWFVEGYWRGFGGVEGWVRRTEGETYCEGYWLADDGCAF
jgi:hypothetical protein